MDKSLLFYAIIIILVVQFVIELILDYLNAQKFDEPIPQELQDVFDQEEYKKAQQYKKTNYRFGLISDTFAFAVTLLFLVFGGFEWIDQLVRQYSQETIPLALLFFGFIFLANSLISIPFSYYKTFTIEERFGFNKTTKKLFFADLLKGWLLAALIGGPVLALILWFIEKAGNDFWLYAWLLMTLLMLFMNLFYSKLIVPLFNKQTPLEEGSLKKSIEAYAQKVGFELKNIFVIDGSKRSTKANAYFTGLGKEKRVTLYDTLINDLDEDEIVAVLAHEVGHYKRHHIVYNLTSSIVLTGLTLFILSLFINNPEMSYAIGVSQPSYHAALIAFALLYSPISQVTGLLMNYLSRKFEFQADNFAKKTFGPDPLASSLKKLSKNNLSNLNPHPAYVFVHYSHPPLKERIRNLRA
ncbi:MAG: peptidase M48 [Muricauda sp.]|nr:M48 family metallopeptidase [Allomuricauda sp.]MAU26733.1 peptidase M48 [Allomuricauda sp.]MBC31500.1 peptidase M48 [Allomuricauda sp.]|tara:strand:+ start:32230 stop:33462 length:1233 start_codon:yes stop_codon:yes gene_type:complete